MLEIYRVAVELMYSRRAKINILCYKVKLWEFSPKDWEFFFFIIVKFLEELFTYLSTDKVFMVITIIKAKLILTDWLHVRLPVILLPRDAK